MKISVGDLIFKDGRTSWNLIGNLIRTIQNNGIHPDNEYCPYHVGIVIEEAEDIKDIKVLNMFMPKIKIQTISKWLENSNINTVIRSYNGFIPDYKRRTMKNLMWAYYKAGVKYDFISVIGIGLKYLIMKKVNNKFVKWAIRWFWNDNVNHKVWLNCAELIWKIYASVGLVPVSFFPDYAMPINYYKSKQWTTVYRHYNFEYPRT